MTARQLIKNQKAIALRSSKGFTLIELLVVIGILAILLAITLIAINPVRQFNQANDTKRKSDVNTVLNAIDQYAADKNGSLPSGIGPTPAAIGNGTGQVDLCTTLVTTYIAALPEDPSTGSPAGNQIPVPCPTGTGSYNTGYNVSSSSNNRVTVSATLSDGTTFSVSR